jgi:predicted protein tyrosine phosphatase
MEVWESDMVAALKRERDELEQTAARIASEAACERLRAEAAEAEVARYRNALTEAVGNKVHAEAEVERWRAAGATVAKAAERFRQEGLADRAEVERLREMILMWDYFASEYDRPSESLHTEACRIRLAPEVK